MPTLKIELGATGEPVAFPFDESSTKWAKRYAGQVVRVSMTGHSLPEHRLLFSYLNWVWTEYYKEKYPDPDDFRDWVSMSIGHYKQTMIEINGAKVVFHKVKSWSFAKCDHELFHEITNLVSGLFDQLHGVSIEKWKLNVGDKYETNTKPASQVGISGEPSKLPVPYRLKLR